MVEALEREGVRARLRLSGRRHHACLRRADRLEADAYIGPPRQAAALAADAYGRVTGEPGVCLATSGPGATNLVTGIANAFLDSVPMVAITGQVGSPLMGTDAFQEVDIFGITLPIVKHSFLIRDPADIPHDFRGGLRLPARAGPDRC